MKNCCLKSARCCVSEIAIKGIPTLYFSLVMLGSALFQERYPILRTQDDSSAANLRILAFGILVIVAQSVYDSIVTPITKKLLSCVNTNTPNESSSLLHNQHNNP